jgi:hypothetical protein
MSFGKALIKAEGSAVVDSLVYKTAGRYAPVTSNQLTIQEGDRTIVVADMLMRLEYILQRTVPNYDELVNQFNAIKDIERSNNEL